MGRGAWALAVSELASANPADSEISLRIRMIQMRTETVMVASALAIEGDNMQSSAEKRES